MKTILSQLAHLDALLSAVIEGTRKGGTGRCNFADQWFLSCCELSDRIIDHLVLASQVALKASKNDNMNPKCAKCEKSVYPTEKLNCLDKIWHKGCFRCATCNLTLSMKTYKGYNKMPYCNTHYPSTKFTAVADTPENKRLAKNTAQQSNIIYHEKFESEKGKYTAVEDDPETLRLKKNTQQISDLAYKGHAPPTQQAEAAQPRSSLPQRDTVAAVETRTPVVAQAPPPQEVQQQPTAPVSVSRYRAMYDYIAADSDEVSFSEGDVITDAEIIDEGWMTGTVEKTGEHGMLPANYVEKI